MKRVVIAATGVNPAIGYMAAGLEQQGILQMFVTTLAFPAGHWLPARYSALSARVVSGLPATRLATWPWLELMRVACTRIDRSGYLADRIWEHMDYRFGDHVDRHLQQADAVLGFEHASLETFMHARSRGLVSIYNVPSAHSGLIRQLLADQPAVHAGKRLNAAIEARRQARRDREMDMADLVIAHSAFTRRSYADAGFDASKIEVIPLGAPPVRPELLQGDAAESSRNSRPVFLFAGNFALHKGAHILLDAWRSMGVSGARLLIAGDVHLAPDLLQQLPAGVELLGRVDSGRLQQLYRQATALVLPSLSDGFGMVITEALANGLPVITTPNAGASDLIRPGENGLLVPVLDASALSQAMQSLAEQPQLVSVMRLEAARTAARWQWSDFALAFARCIGQYGGARMV